MRKKRYGCPKGNVALREQDDFIR